MSRPATVLANDFRAHWYAIREDALAAVTRVGESGWLVLGREVETFESEVAAFHGIPYCVGTANGLDALEIALRCAGVGRGDVVLTTPLTAFATTLAILRVGARPAFVDVDRSGLLDLDLAEEAIAQARNVRAIVPVHLYGHALDVARLSELAQRTGVRIVEDCAQAIGARHEGTPVGSASVAAITSFYPTKNLGALGDAGALFTSDATIRDRAASLRDYGQSSKYVHAEPGINSRLDELHAAILRSAILPRLPRFTERRAEIARAYIAGISNEALRVLPIPAGSESVWHLFPVQVARRSEREHFLAHMRSAGVTVAVHYPTLTSNQPALAGAGAIPLTSLSQAEEIAQTEASLPIHPFLTEEEVGLVIDACNRYEP